MRLRELQRWLLFVIVVMHAAIASAQAQALVGRWHLDVERSQLNSALQPYRDTLQQRLAISLVDGAVQIDMQTRGVPWRTPFRLALTPGCCFEAPPPPDTLPAPAISRLLTDRHFYLLDDIAHPFDLAFDEFPPPKGARRGVWLPDLTGFDMSEEWFDHERRQRFRINVDGTQLIISTIETFRGGSEQLVRVFVREP